MDSILKITLTCPFSDKSEFFTDVKIVETFQQNEWNWIQKFKWLNLKRSWNGENRECSAFLLYHNCDKMSVNIFSALFHLCKTTTRFL